MAFTYTDTEINGHTGIEISSYVGNDKRLSIPAEIDGKPVISIGKYAFTDACKELEEIYIPESVNTIKAFAFYFCGKLRKVVLTDSVTDYYDGAFRTCSAVSDIEVTMSEDHSELVHRMLNDSDRKMRVTFKFREDGSMLRLVFPEYNNNSIADPRAQTFHIRIEGSGFSYRECVRQDVLKIKEYDSLFRKAVADDNDLAIDIAVSRLMYPARLSDSDKAAYKAHLEANIMRAAELAMEDGNEEWTEVLIHEDLLNEEALDRALQLASELKKYELISMLMDYSHEHMKDKPASKLSLDNWEF